MMLDYGASEVRYLLDLLGSWPFAYGATIAIFTLLLPYLEGLQGAQPVTPEKYAFAFLLRGLFQC